MEGTIYQKCLNCEYLGAGHEGICCNGPDIGHMSITELCRWFRALKIKFDLTNKEIAEKAQISLQTVTNIMAQKPPNDIKWYTITQIVKALLGEGGNAPCAMALLADNPGALKDLEIAKAEMKILKDIQKDIHSAHEKEIAAIRAEAKQKTDFLVAEIEKRDRVIQRLLDK